MVPVPPRHRIGRLQKAVRRALWASRVQELRTSDLLPWCFLAAHSISDSAAMERTASCPALCGACRS